MAESSSFGIGQLTLYPGLEGVVDWKDGGKMIGHRGRTNNE